MAGAESDRSRGYPAVEEARSVGWKLDAKAVFEQAKAEEDDRALFLGSTVSALHGDGSEVFSQEAFIDYADENLVMMKLDFTRERLPVSEEFAAQHSALMRDLRVYGFPSMVLISPEGQVLGKFMAYRSGGAEAYIEFLGELMAQK